MMTSHAQYPAQNLTDFHDCNLIGIELKDPNLVELKVKDEDGSIWHINVPKVSRLTSDNFWEGNIILSMSLRRSDTITTKEVQELYHLSDSSPKLEELANKARCNNWSLVIIDATYGCNLILLSTASVEEIQIERVN
jgi:hypothetical protein